MSRRRKKPSGRPAGAPDVAAIMYQVALEHAANVAGDPAVPWLDALERLDAAVLIGGRLRKTPDAVVDEWIDLSTALRAGR
ncbi:hypothetical protein [Nocardioides sp. L-11A]|uniref:hypothetical protein n=1 Tax=Nocardioides sp. L-11A TaxID=3043848 RepID=UPI00249C5325|nr:hypothetical protein QJ852_15320 [Nocardioides sp. L-11A]